VAFAVKTTTGALLLLAAALALAARRWRDLRAARGAGTPACRAGTHPGALAPYAAAIAVAIYFAGACVSHIDIGLRFLLPVYPLLYLLLAAWLWGQAPTRVSAPRAGRVVLLACLVLHVAECARIHPYYTAFFNTLSGGPARGSEYLVDSNIDWGQDLLRLGRYMAAHGETSPCLFYFGKPDPILVFSHWSYLPRTEDTAARAEMNCLAAISVTVLRNVYVHPGEYTWMWSLKPAARVGYSINVYDLRRK